MKYNVKLNNFFEKYEKIGGSTYINDEYKSNIYKIPSMNSYNVIGGKKKKKIKKPIKPKTVTKKEKKKRKNKRQI